MRRKKTIKQRTRYFLAVEGESEQSFVKWLQHLADENGLHVHLDCQPLGGGGYEVMLNRAVRYSQRKDRHRVKSSILLVDADRSVSDDNWSQDKLREVAFQHKFIVVFQVPNLEGVLLRLLSGNERLQSSSTSSHVLLRRAWPDYNKPADARTLRSKVALKDLLRVAQIDLELKNLVEIIGLYDPQ